MDVQGILDLLFDDPSDDDDIIYHLPPERQHHPKIPNFFETVVLTYSLTGETRFRNVTLLHFIIITICRCFFL